MISIMIILLDNMIINEYNSNRGDNMIKCNLSILMGKAKMNIQDVSNATGLARNTVGNLYRDTATRVDYNTIDSLCGLFNCEVGELFTREKDL